MYDYLHKVLLWYLDRHKYEIILFLAKLIRESDSATMPGFTQLAADLEKAAESMKSNHMSEAINSNAWNWDNDIASRF